jgi:A/G-specific adenine glycosylase
MNAFARRLLAWYATQARELPWRGQQDPYAIWISEIMLQQTRVETVIPFYDRWMRRFPTVSSLARAPERAVLKAWEGLGYYARARNLQRAARLIHARYADQLPSDVAALRELPGIGRYTAGAIASIAFGLDEAALDGNIRRVLARVFNFRQVADSPEGAQKLWELAAAQLPAGRAGDYNQALMDLGATVCLARDPRCAVCPLRSLCRARRLGVQHLLPVMRLKRAVPHYTEGAAVILRAGCVLIVQRPAAALLGGLWEFPNGRAKVDPSRELAKLIHQAYQIEIRRRETLGVVEHAYTHFKVTVQVFRAEARKIGRKHPGKWVDPADLKDYPMGKVDRRIAAMVREVLRS